MDYEECIDHDIAFLEQQYPEKKAEDIVVVDFVYDRIEKADIWIPYGEVFIHYKNIKVKLCRRIRRNADAGGKVHSRHPNQRVNFMNMCMISVGREIWWHLKK